MSFVSSSLHPSTLCLEICPDTWAEHAPHLQQVLSSQNEKISVFIDSQSTIGKVEEVVAEKLKMPADHVSLIFLNQDAGWVPLSPDQRIETISKDYFCPSVTFKRCGNLEHCPNKLRIYTLKGFKTCIPFAPEETWVQIKQKVAASTGLPAYRQRMIRNGVQLNNREAIGDLPHGASVHIVERLPDPELIAELPDDQYLPLLNEIVQRL